MADEPRGDDDRRARSLAGGLRETYSRLTPGRRRLLWIVAIALVAGLAALVVVSSSQAPWRVVARDMAPEDLDAAAHAFDEKKIVYKLGEDSSILVAPESIHEARLALAVNAMPSGKSVGFEVFDESSMGRSAFTEKVNLHRALEGELARTIRAIDGVEKARVHLVTPERRVFKELEVAPSAAVIVSLKPGYELTRDKALAIRQLVSGAVERLEPGKVSIVDQHGRMLTRPEDANATSGDGFERQREQEQAIEDKVVKLLEPMVGNDKVLARVALDLDLSRLVETKEDFDPNQTVVRSEREQLEKDQLAGQGPAGPPGTASNLPGRPAPVQPGGANEAGREKSDTIRNYEVDKVVTRREDPLPRVRKMSVAVLVDEATELKDGKPVARPRTQDELTQLSRLVSHAVGLDPTRGDQIDVTSAPFAPEAESPFEEGGPAAVPEGAPQELPWWEQPVVWIAAGAGALLLIVALVALLTRGRSKQKASALTLAVATGDAAKAEAAHEPPPPPIDRPKKIAELREKVLALGNEDVHRLAVVFERWFEQDDALEAKDRDKEAA